MACLGDAASIGQSQVTDGWRLAMAAAVILALLDAGDDRKPCKYRRWVIFMREW